MENETREVVYLAVSLMLIAMVISFLVYGLGLVNSISANRNEEVIANENIEEYREFNAYDGKTLIGDEVIELIRQKYDEGIEIFIDNRYNAALSKRVDSKITCSLCNNKSGDHRIYSLDMYLLHKNTSEDYFTLSTHSIASGSVGKNDMRNWFPTKDKFRAYLVYDSQAPLDFYNKLIDNYNKVKGGYDTTENGRTLALDSGIKAVDPSAKVTGVVLVSYRTLGLS